MHELGITQDIVAIAADYARGAKVRRVVVEIGRCTAVLPDAVRFCFDICAEGTAVQGAHLEIIDVKARARCHTCGSEQEFEQPIGLCPCGSSDVEWVSGDELRIRTVEIDRCA